MRENVVEEDEDMISERIEQNAKDEEEEKRDRHNQPYFSTIPVAPHAKDKTRKNFLYHRTSFRFMVDFYKSMFL